MAQLERRTFLSGIVAVTAAEAVGMSALETSAAPVGMPGAADLLSDAIDAYWAETEENAKHDRDLSVTDTPAFDYLAYGDLPAPTTRDCAIKTLKLAIDEHEMFGGDEIITNLMSATLAYLEVLPA